MFRGGFGRFRCGFEHREYLAVKFSAMTSFWNLDWNWVTNNEKTLEILGIGSRGEDEKEFERSRAGVTNLNVNFCVETQKSLWCKKLRALW
jgi:hypothetical protein